MRTGDLGLIDDGELFVTGRLKDIVIQRGMKFHAEDIEGTVRDSSAVGPACQVAAFSVETPEGEAVIVAYESAEPAHALIRNHVRLAHGLEVSQVIRLKRGRIPRTSSGKVQRGRCRELFLAGELA